MGGFLTKAIFKDNRLLFSYCFLEIFVGDKAVMKEDKVVIGGSPH